MADLPPGPTSHPAVQTYRYAFDTFPFLEECADRYGGTFTLRFVRVPPFVIFNDPDIIKEIFSAPAEVMQVGEANAPLEFALGRHSLLLLDGKRHERDRRLLMPPFHGERMVNYLDQILAITDRVIDAITPGEAFSVHHAMQTITLDVIMESIFGIMPGPRQDRLRDLLQTFMAEGTRAYMSILGMFVEGTPLRNALVQRVAPVADRLAFAPEVLRRVPTALLSRTMRDLDRILFDDIAARRAEGVAGRTDVMSMLIAARDEDGRGLSDDELHDEMITLLIAGHETTATTLTFAVSTLLEERAIADRIREELGRVAGGRAPSFEDLREMRYLEATIREVLRLYGPASGFGRQLAAPMRLGGHDLPKGTLVSMSTYLLHRDPRIWTDPRRFDPTRFLDRRVRPTAFVPFGGGARTCLGMAFALFEAKAVLARWMSRLTLRAVPGPKLDLTLRGLIFGPSHGVPAVLERRAPRSPASEDRVAARRDVN